MSASRYLTSARPMHPADLEWLLPMAARYGEAPAMLSALRTLILGWVVPGKALVCLYREPDGIRAAGLTDPTGIRACVALGRALLAFGKKHGIYPVYAKADAGDRWQLRFFQQLGFVPDGDRLWLREG